MNASELFVLLCLLLFILFIAAARFSVKAYLRKTNKRLYEDFFGWSVFTGNPMLNQRKFTSFWFRGGCKDSPDPELKRRCALLRGVVTIYLAVFATIILIVAWRVFSVGGSFQPVKPMKESFPNVYAVIVVILTVSVFIWWALGWRLRKLLKARHPEIYNAMGRGLVKFIFKREYRELNDPSISRLSQFMLLFYVVWIVAAFYLMITGHSQIRLN